MLPNNQETSMGLSQREYALSGVPNPCCLAVADPGTSMFKHSSAQHG